MPITTNILPDILEFGEPDINFYPELEDVESHQIDTGGTTVDVEPYGYDIGFDIYTGDLLLSVSGDLRIVSESNSLNQWVATVLTTTPGADLIYSSSFGAGLDELVGQDLPDIALQNNIRQNIREALLVHDRIEDIRSFTFDTTIKDLLVISFVVITDTAEELVFEGLQLGR